MWLAATANSQRQSDQFWFRFGGRRLLPQSKNLHLFVPQLVQSLHVLSHHVLFYNLSSPDQILAVFPESFHSSLKNLITKILLENRYAPRNQSGLPAVRTPTNSWCFSVQRGGQKRSVIRVSRFHLTKTLMPKSGFLYCGFQESILSYVSCFTKQANVKLHIKQANLSCYTLAC